MGEVILEVQEQEDEDEEEQVQDEQLIIKYSSRNMYIPQPHKQHSQGLIINQ